jgi:hypothetical protein
MPAIDIRRAFSLPRRQRKPGAGEDQGNADRDLQELAAG